MGGRCTGEDRLFFLPRLPLTRGNPFPVFWKEVTVPSLYARTSPVKAAYFFQHRADAAASSRLRLVCLAIFSPSSYSAAVWSSSVQSGVIGQHSLNLLDRTLHQG